MTKTPEHDEALVGLCIDALTSLDAEKPSEGGMATEAISGSDLTDWEMEVISRQLISIIRTTDAARIAELERQLVEYQRPTAEQVETFQQACERGFQMPSDPPPWPEMLKLAETFLARATLRSNPDAG